MPQQRPQENGKQQETTSQDNFRVASPSITLPKGGGAVRGIGEKFSANPVTGTGSMSVPIATSPGRSGFGPQLSISYDSGAGNGIFGFGWSLSIPSITRKTDKGLPQYRDAEDSDVFILSGAEDLVPSQKSDKTITVDGKLYSVRRYRPRIEGLFARIERWTQQSTNDVHWRSISKDNILTLYGKDEHSRIADPENPQHIFSWLICETRDDKGNAILYEYKREDGEGVTLANAHERNRGDPKDPHRTANRYLKRIRYGNSKPLLDDGQRPPFLKQAITDWMFEVVFDYGEHTAELLTPDEDGTWGFRLDPFSSYRSGFEVRTTRLCRRVLMFHHIPDLPNQPNSGYEGLVRSTDFSYSDPASVSAPIYTFLTKVTQTGYKPNGNGYLSRSLPPVEFDYSQPIVQDIVETVGSASLENLPIGLDGTSYQWVDLHGEGIPGILTEQANAWYYKRNFSPIHDDVKFDPLERVALKPNLSLSANAQIMDLAGDGQPDLVVLDDPVPGFYEHDGEEGWQPFRPFTSRLNRNTRDPNLKFVDLDGDGHADILISEDNALVWHASLAEQGVGPAQRVAQALDEEKGPRLVFADGTQSIYLADLSGDGLTDLVRIRNGEVCYWPNLGYCRFGAKITMDNAPWFDNPDQFDHKRIRLADIDGSGTTDLIYLHRDGVKLYFNQSGNGWGDAQALSVFPAVDDMASIMAVDLLGNGTACLVWSSPLPTHRGRQMRYVNLMGGQKPHLLINTRNNLGAETRVHYAPSTQFYLQDKRDGKPWITKLPFPVHVMERVETYDHISRNRFVTRYAYHHGYFDGEEREFRGFGMVEQWDTEEFTALTASSALPVGDNINAASHVPPVLTRTWFHTGFYLDKQHISRLFALEYYREPGLTDEQFHAQLLADTLVPVGLGIAEEREACRTLKGAMLRQEIYALDDTPAALHPYSVVEQNFTIQRLQARADNRHAVFFTHPREAITYHYERNPADPRIQHALTLEVDTFGNVQKALAIGYGRRQADNNLPTPEDRHKQTQTLITYTDGLFTNVVNEEYDYRTPLPAAVRTYELSGFNVPTPAEHFRFSDWERNGFAWLDALEEIQYEAIPNATTQQKRLIEHVQTRYRKNDLSGLLPWKELESLALPGESYKLAFTPGLLAQVFQRNGQALLPDLAHVLGGKGGDQGGYVDLDGNGQWWLSSGRSFFHPDDVPAAIELTKARSHFFLPRRYRDPFRQDAVVDFAHDLLMVETRDALDNRVTVEANDYRVLQPRLVTDPNRNRTEVSFDALGMVVGTAVMGKASSSPAEGDTLTGFIADLEQTRIDQFAAKPRQPAGSSRGEATPVVHALLQEATTRIVYDLHRFMRVGEPPFTATIAREMHVSDLVAGQQSPLQVSFSYSDGFGREVQKKIQAEPGSIAAGEPVTNPRWVGSGWMIFNNKGKPVRQYEPFFSATHHFEFGQQVGVSPILFYDPAERVVATLHPNHTFEKVLFDPWQQTTWDVNDTVLLDPRTDANIAGYVKEHFKTEPAWQTWHQQRINGAKGTHEQQAASKTEAHANTPTVVYFDSLGRPFLTVAHNKVACKDHDLDGTEDQFATRVELDIEGNQREVRDAIVQAGDPLGRVVMRYAYDMLGNRLHQASMEAGERWMLNDVTGKSIRAWDSRGHIFTTRYDELRRPLEQRVSGTTADSDSRTLNRSLLVDRIEYGELLGSADAERLNLRTRVHKHSDSAGIVVNEAYDFKGNLLRSSRQLVTDYKGIPDWVNIPPPALESEVFSSSTRYDALSRPMQAIAPHHASAKLNIIQPVFNEANLLERVDVWLEQSAESEGFLDSNLVVPSPVGVDNIDYDAKGQRQCIDYKNGASTFYEYDPLTFRLTHLLTRRKAANFPGDDPSPPITGCSGRYLQNLHYTYDPAGNITHIHDDAQQTVYFRNKCVDPSNDYTYDALYRLIEATGREHLGQAGHAPVPHSHHDAPRVGLLHPGDGNAMGRYTERYVYDAVGNFLEMQHRGSDPAHPGWMRRYAYNESSLTEPAKQSNRLSSTTVGNGSAVTESYAHDAHGNMLRMPHLQVMTWDYKDQLQLTQRQTVNDEDTDGTARQGERTYYVYDTSGQRVRKVTELATGGLKDERIYLGGFEIYRQHAGTHTGLERETLHIMDDKQRIALVETRNGINDGSSKQLIRYQYGNHLGSANLELDDQAQIISYEEYSPYGSTTYQAVRNRTESAKRYRYTGKERDEESGLYYHEARYYAANIGVWTTPDPLGIVYGVNTFTYGNDQPTKFIDRTGMAPEKTNQNNIESNYSSNTSTKSPIEIGIRTSSTTPNDLIHYIDTSTRSQPNINTHTKNPLPKEIRPTIQKNEINPVVLTNSLFTTPTPEEESLQMSLVAGYSEAVGYSTKEGLSNINHGNESEIKQTTDFDSISKMREAFIEKDKWLYGITSAKAKTIDCSGLARAMLERAYPGFMNEVDKDPSKWNTTGYVQGGADKMYNFILSGQSKLGNVTSTEITDLTKENLQGGDLIFWDYKVGKKEDKYINHIAIILSPTELAHSRGSPGARDSGPTLNNPEKASWLNDMDTKTTTKIYLVRATRNRP